MSGNDNTSYTVRTAAGTTDTVSANDYVVIYTNSAAKTATLPAVATTQPGREYQFICQNTGVLTLDPNASETINGATTLAVTAGTVGGVTGRVSIVSDGTQWFTLYSQ
jgi:hydroxyethylthiazole kinase-like sugar kinase family protein